MGTQNENEITELTFEIPEEYQDWNKRIVFITSDGKFWDYIQDNTYLIKKNITKYKEVQAYIWLTNEEEDFRTREFTLKFYHNEEAESQVPTEEQIDGFNTLITTLNLEITRVDNKENELNGIIADLQYKLDTDYFKGEKGDKGEQGTAGISPTVETETIEDGVRVTITDVQGTHIFKVLNGKDGEVDEEVVSQAVTEYLDTHSIVVPTKISDLTNDSNFVEDANYVHTDNNYSTQEKQKLQELSNYDDTEISQAIQNKVDKEQGKSLILDTEIQRLANITNYNDTEVKQSITNLNNNKANKNEIPDVSSFITKTVNDLTNYYLKNETYSRAEVNSLIGQISTVSIEVVQALPANAQTNVIYFVPKTGTTDDVYNEYIYVNDSWELIGNTEIDLTGYATENWVNVQIANFLTQAQIETLISNSLTGYARTQDIPTNLSELNDDSTHRLVTDAEKNTWNGKANMSDILDVSSFITNTANNLTNYYSKSEIDTALDNYISEIASLVGGDA